MIDLEDKLIKGAWVTPEELLKARQDQEKRKKSIFCSLIMLGYMNQEEVFKFFALNTNIPLVKLSDYRISEDVVGLIREDFCRNNLVMPLFRMDSSLFVAMANPLDTDLIVNISNNTRLDIHVLLASAIDIITAIDYYSGYPDSFFAIENLMFEPQKLSNFPFYRSSSRKHLSISAELRVNDKRVLLPSNRAIPAVTIDISSDGTAVGVKTTVFIPQNTRLVLSLLRRNVPENLDIDAEVIYCRMDKPNEFSMGIKVLSENKNVINYLKRLVEHR